MTSTPEDILYEGVSVLIAFDEPRPTFGDLFLLCGEAHPNFPPSGAIDFSEFVDLQITQVDDYFGVPSLAEEGGDVAVWLFPIVGNESVHHHQGPFDAIRLEYCVLRSPARYAQHFLLCIAELSRIGSRIEYCNRELELGQPPDLDQVNRDIEEAVSYWADRGITVGSEKALRVDF